MIENSALKIAHFIKRQNPEGTASIEVMKFSLIILLNGAITAGLTLAIGALTGKFTETFICLVLLVMLRLISGGYHFKSAMACTLVSTFCVAILPHIPMNSASTLILTVISIPLFLVLAPSNIQGVARMPEKYFFYLKLLALVLVTSNLYWQSPNYSLVCILQGVSLFKFKEV